MRRIPAGTADPIRGRTHARAQLPEPSEPAGGTRAGAGRGRLPVRRRPFELYVAALAAVAAAGLGGDARIPAAAGWLGPEPAVVVLLAVCGLTAELWTVQPRERDGAGEVTGSWAFVGAVLLLAPPLTAALVALAVSLVGDAARRKPPATFVCNAATMVIAVSAAATVLRLAPHQGRPPWPAHPGFALVAVVVAAVLGAFVANVVLTGLAIAIDGRLSIHRAVTAQRGEAVVLDLSLLTLAPVFVVAGERSLLLLAPLLAATAVALRTAARSLRRRHDATHDPLTGLANRRLFDQELDAVLRVGAPGDDPVALVLVDLDGFKSINDSYGHEHGDRVLVEVAERMAAVCRPSDVVARIGGDEFALLLPRTDPAAAGEVVARLEEAIDRPIDLDGTPASVGASAGLAVAPGDGCSAGALLRSADDAMYQAKLRLGPPPPPAGRSGSAGELARAIGGGELFLEYQPVVSIGDAQPVGVEALVRWRHPEAGVLGPAAFLPLAERANVMGSITEWVLREAVRQAAEWDAAGQRLRVAVNVSPRDLEDRRFPGLVKRLLADSGLDASRLVLELADGAALREERSRPGLSRLSELGVAIAVDDFGVGTTTIAQLRDLPVDQVKLDRRFVAGLGRDDRDERVLDALVALAAALGIETVAEGVEEPYAVELLRRSLCAEAQGFAFAPPMSASALTAWVGDRAIGVPGRYIDPAFPAAAEVWPAAGA